VILAGDRKRRCCFGQTLGRWGRTRACRRAGYIVASTGLAWRDFQGKHIKPHAPYKSNLVLKLPDKKSNNALVVWKGPLPFFADFKEKPSEGSAFQFFENSCPLLSHGQLPFGQP